MNYIELIPKLAGSDSVVENGNKKEFTVEKIVLDSI